MTIEKNDPRLTAFVLGELSEDETKEVQAALYADTELHEEVEAIRKTVAEIEDFMKNEPIPGEPKVSTPGAIDTPEKHTKKRRWYRPTLIEACCLIGIAGVCIALLMPAQQAARHSSKRAAEQLKAIQAEMDGLPSATMPESEPIDDAPLRYENTREFRGAPTSGEGGAISGQGALEQSEKKDEAPKLEVATSDVMAPNSLMGNMGETSGSQPKSEPRLAVGSGPTKPASPPLQGNGIPFQREAEHSSGKITVGLSAPGEITADLSIPVEQGSYGLSDPTYGGYQVEKSEAPAAGGKPTRGMGDMDGRPAPGARAGRPKRLDISGKSEEDLSITMMVTPKIVVQEEEEEYLTGLRDAEGKPVQLGRPLRDPYNSANDEAYKNFVENDFLRPQKAPFSTFSIDVDTAAYTTMRRYINQGQRPPTVSVRLEEYVNFFKYDYAQPTDGQLSRGEAFATHVDVAPCPWEPKHLLARIGIKGKEYTVDERPPLNLVFLIDTSGSMESSNRLPLVQRGLTELVEMLQPKDRVAIVTYAGSSKVALPSVSGQEKRAILDSINSLNASGSTAGAAGIKTAYETARKYYDKNAQNRVILCTDGDFNVGTTDNSQLERMIGEEAKSGVFLTILGFGMGNYKDERLKTLSMRGNGNYGYVDTIEEARRLLVEGLTGTLFAIAKDVKIQVDFNPARVAAYRLLGYENRKLRDDDFHNDKIDAGEIGAGHTVTALYEIVPVGGVVPSKVDESRYAEKPADEKPGSSADATHPALEGELMFVKLRYKQPDGGKSSLLEYPVVYEKDATLSDDAEFAAGVALYGMLLRLSRYSGAGTFDAVLELAEPNVKDDPYRKEFVELVRKAKELR